MLGSINNLATSLNVPGASNVNTSGTASVNIPGANGTTNKTVTPNADNTGVADAEAKTPSDVKPRTARGSASAPADDSDDSSDIVKQLKKQIEKQGYAIAGNSLEITLVDRGFTSDEQLFVTEVQIPVKRNAR